MKRNWELDELIDHFTLMPDELKLIQTKRGDTKLGFAVLFKFFQYEARFPYHKNEIPKSLIHYLAKQLFLNPDVFEQYDWTGRTISYHRTEIRNYFGFREVEKQDIDEMVDWLCKSVLYHNHELNFVEDQVYKRFRELGIEPPALDRMERLIHSAVNSYEQRFFNATYNKLSKPTLAKLDSLIESIADMEDTTEENSPTDSLSFNELKSDPGRVGLDTVFKELQKLRTIRQLNLPHDLFKEIPPKIIRKYRQRTATEDISALRRHPEPIRYTLLSSFFWLRNMEITDNLIELLIQIIHRINVRAERKVEKEILISGKTSILFNMAEQALSNPDGIIKEVLYPVVSEQTLKDLVKEFKHTGLAYREKVHTVIRSSYSTHYRRMVPPILNTLTFCSNNEVHRAVIKALDLIKSYSDSGMHYFPTTEDIPIDGVIRSVWRSLIIEKDENSDERINRINYEISALQSLRDRLRCKEIWVEGSDRYRNPDEDLPQDFEERREENYKALNKPLDAETFVENIKSEVMRALEKLNNRIPKNPSVRITTKGNGWISVSPYEPLPEPMNLSRLKGEVMKRWPMTSLLDILKETDLRVNFTDQLKTVGNREILDRKTIQKRAWDQNLMTEWHIRYRGRGVMIYWHVSKNSTCIYSQLKSCSSSEVASMIEGLLRHCTDMDVQKNYVDTHGQSEVAFAFCHLLGFQLMPRLKSIHSQKLYRPDVGMTDSFPNVQPVLTRPINWELIRQQYDQMVKYATALRLGIAETEAILKRFTRNNMKHPTYQALSELGKAIKTIFLCEYLDSEEMRREIHEGLNVVENWNSANSFIFYGKGGEIATNRLEDQEIAVLSLHLLQNCLVYINTLMLQNVLSEKTWFDKMTTEDFRALTPLIYTHVNPYGTFRLDMTERIKLEGDSA
ncbi:MAG: Tn3 family transposase [Bacillota bacterium]